MINWLFSISCIEESSMLVSSDAKRNVYSLGKYKQCLECIRYFHQVSLRLCRKVLSLPKNQQWVLKLETKCLRRRKTIQKQSVKFFSSENIDHDQYKLLIRNEVYTFLGNFLYVRIQNSYLGEVRSKMPIVIISVPTFDLSRSSFITTAYETRWS